MWQRREETEETEVRKKSSTVAAAGRWRCAAYGLGAEAVSAAFCWRGAPKTLGHLTGGTNRVLRAHQTAALNRSIHAGCCHQRYSVHHAGTPPVLPPAAQRRAAREQNGL